jgi:two-component sensor histidine kinase
MMAQKSGLCVTVRVEVEEMTSLGLPSTETPPTDAAARYRALFDNMAEGFVVCEAIRGPDGRLADYWLRAANPVFLKRAPLNGPVIDRRQLDIRPDTSKQWLEACERALAGGAVRFEFEDPISRRWYEVHMARLSATEFGQFFVDVTDRKTAEQRSVQLFTELNHRVKNNLAIASSVLELQARTSPPTVRDQLRKAVDRLYAIADLHTALYHRNSMEQVDLGPYLDELCRRLSASLFEPGQAQIELQCQACEATMDQAVSIGLIVNELITNAAKYAFPHKAQGVVRVILTANNEELHLTVADNGRGLPASGPGEGLGLRLVRSLASGLGGEVRLEPGAGATFHLCAPRRVLTTNVEVQPRLF